jgi:hypothetical protein
MTELPLISEPPFFRPIEPHEFALVINPGAGPAPPGAFDLGEGWTPSFFSFLVPEGRAAVWGWTKGSFAIDERYCEFPDCGKTIYCAVLTYLPNGYRVAIFNSSEDATLAASLLARELDWSDSSPEALLAQGRRALVVIMTRFDEREDMQPYAVWCARFDGEIARAHG